MGCGCGKKNKQQRTQQQLQKARTTQQKTVSAKDYVNAVRNVKK